MSIMDINNRGYFRFNVMRISIAVLVLLSAIHDFVFSFTDVTIQAIAISDKMGYESLKEFRFHMLLISLQAVVYTFLVILHITRWKEKHFVTLVASVDFVVLSSYLFRMLNF